MKTTSALNLNNSFNPSRRAFIGNVAVVAAGASLLAAAPNVFAAGGSDRLKIGVVGCGGRGVGAAFDCLNADPSVQLWAIGDVFADVTKKAQDTFKKRAAADRNAITDDRCFSGFDAFKNVINSGIDLVILATPPNFRPEHMEEAVKAGIHIFAEKPVAVDPVGARKVIAVAELAAQKKLSIVAGTQRRHSNVYLETLKRVLNGDIGELVGGQSYWMGGELWHRGRKPEWSEMEYQIRNWLYFTRLSGDHIVEQHVHNIDVMNWAFGGPPVKAIGVGGRQTRTDEKYGDIYDHFSIEYEYAGGVRVQGTCRQANGASGRVTERIVGTLGVATPGRITGKNEWKFTGNDVNPYVQEHVDLIKAIRSGKPLNEAKTVAESTLTAILGRMVAYTGKEIKYGWMLEASKLDLSLPPAFGDVPKTEIAVPGKTQPV